MFEHLLNFLHNVYQFTCNDEFQVKGVLPGSVAGDAGVDASITARHRLNDE